MVPPQARIGIIGAGAGGLSLARVLGDLGLERVTVLEKSDRVGGMSLTLEVAGALHELGTCYTLAGYDLTTRWMREANVRGFRLSQHEYLLRDGRLVSFREFVKGQDSFGTGLSKVLSYIRHWLPFHRWDLQGNPDDATDASGRPFREVVAQSFGQWLTDRELGPIAKMSLRAVTAAGYGALDELPALYGLRWVTPALLWSGVTSRMSEPLPGWQTLWTHLASTLDIRTNCQVIRCEPTSTGWAIATSRGDFEFDHLVVAAPLHQFLSDGDCWLPLESERREALGLNGTLSWREYTASLVEVRNWFRQGHTRAFEAAAVDSAARRQCRLLVGRRALDKATGAGPLPGNLYLVYQYSDPDLSNDVLTKILRDDLAADGAELAAVLHRRRWRYSPQFAPEAIASGAVARFEHWQGRRNLWFTGAVASHESVDNIVCYNQRLADRLVAAIEGRDPASATVLDEVAHRHRSQGKVGPLKALA